MELIIIYRVRAKEDIYLNLKNNLILYNGRLIVLKNGKLRTVILKAYYKSILTAYLKFNKIRKIII